MPRSRAHHGRVLDDGRPAWTAHIHGRARKMRHETEGPRLAMVLSHQPNEMQFCQSGLQHCNEHLEVHVLKATRDVVSIGRRCSTRMDQTLDTQMKRTSWEREQEQGGLTQCEVHDLGTSTHGLPVSGNAHAFPLCSIHERSRQRCPIPPLTDCTRICTIEAADPRQKLKLARVIDIVEIIPLHKKQARNV